MKSSLVAMTTALALTLGVASATFAQDAAPAMPTPEECAALQSAAPTSGTDGTATSTSTGDDSNASDGPPAEGLNPEGEQDIAALCAEMEDTQS
jgi:hypothetical protein